MKPVLLSLCLTAAVVATPTTLDRSRVLSVEGDVSIETLPLTLIVIPLPQHQVHGVVVNMSPTRIVGARLSGDVG